MYFHYPLCNEVKREREYIGFTVSVCLCVLVSPEWLNLL